MDTWSRLRSSPSCRSWIGRSVSASGDSDRVADAATMGRSAQVVASALVAARFLPIWLATAALLVVAAIIAPSTLQNTSWAYVLPYMTILAIAALGQMLVVMQAGIDLSTAGVISLGGNLIVGVSVGDNHGLAVGILACVGLGALVGLVNGILVGIVQAEPADRHAGRRADRARVELEVRARGHELVAGAGVALVVGGGEASRHQRRLLDGRRDHGRRRARASLHVRRAALPGGGREPASRVDGRAARPNARRVRVHGGGRLSTASRRSCSPASASTSTRPSAPPTCSRRSPRSSSRARRSPAGWPARRRPGWRRSRSPS